ncbi:MAG: hypothetical protein ABSE51_17740 [Terracidiphilus sp.]|jgi:hypothetical protein
MAWKYQVLELVGQGVTKEVSSQGGFATEDDAIAAGNKEANRIVSLEIDPLKKTTYTIDASKES